MENDNCCWLFTKISHCVHVQVCAHQCVKDKSVSGAEKEGEGENITSVLRSTQQGKGVLGGQAEAGTLRRLAAGNRWSGERKHDQDVCSYAKRSKGAGRSADEMDLCILFRSKLCKDQNLSCDLLYRTVILT